MLAQKYIACYFDSFSGRSELFESSVVQGVVTGVLAIYGDLGIVGSILFLGLHVYALARILRQYNLGLYQRGHRLVQVEALLAAAILYGMLSCLTDVFSQHVLQYGIWICVAVLWRA